MQQHSDKLHPVASGGKKLTHAERKHSTIKKECLEKIQKGMPDNCREVTKGGCKGGNKV